MAVVPLEASLSGFTDRGLTTAVELALLDEGCEVVARAGPVDRPAPLASVSKLVPLVLAAQLVDDGELALDERLVIDSSSRSLPSGSWHLLPDGAERTVGEAMGAMLFASDNTATDLLVDHLGEQLVAEASHRYHATPADEPFLLTSDVFKLNWSVDDTIRAAYAAASPPEQRALLNDVIRPTELPSSSEIDQTGFQVLAWTGRLDGLCPLWRDLLGTSWGRSMIGSMVGSIELDAIAADPVLGKSGFGPGVSAFSGVICDRCDRLVSVSVSVSGDQVDSWDSAPFLYEFLDGAPDAPGGDEPCVLAGSE